jgi:hypothetical protein
MESGGLNPPAAGAAAKLCGLVEELDRLIFTAGPT